MNDYASALKEWESQHAAELAEYMQYAAGFRACMAGEGNDPAQSDRWQAGWQDAAVLGSTAPAAALRMDKE